MSAISSLAKTEVKSSLQPSLDVSHRRRLRHILLLSVPTTSSSIPFLATEQLHPLLLSVSTTSSSIPFLATEQLHPLLLSVVAYPNIIIYSLCFYNLILYSLCCNNLNFEVVPT